MTNPNVERHEFQAEVTQLLNLVIHSLYSNKDIFLRELISNASDALDKLHFEQITKGEVAAGEPHIRIDLDRTKRTLSVIDNGIGMTRDEVVKNIGTIARSGTKSFLAAVKEAQRKELPPELIGQFGVGFYSAFMVADKVELLTRRAPEGHATLWESTGDGSYSISDAEREQPGTTVTLHLKPDLERDYADHQVVREIVKRYSDFVAYPIRMKVWKTKPEGPSQVQTFEDETLNSMKAIWDRPKGEVSENEYREFYRHLTHDWTHPLRTIPVRMEGTIEAYALLYIPSKPPLDLYSSEMKRGLHLYVKRVLIMDECNDLLPTHLRFIKGVVDAHDLPLNVSREVVQRDRQVQIIRKNLVKKVLATLDEMKRDAHKDYVELWSAFGPVIKEGLLAYDTDDKDKLLDLVLAWSTANATEPTTLDQYVSRMKPGQEKIYYLTGASRESAAKSPLLEAFNDKGYEVLLFVDPIDELWIERAPQFKDKRFQSIGRGELDLGSPASPASEQEQQKEKEAAKAKQDEYRDFCTKLRVLLQDDVKEVRLSKRLTSSPVCLVSDEHDPSPRLQKLLASLGQSPPQVKPILELNPNHALLPKLQAIFNESPQDPRLKRYAELLLGLAQLADSGQLSKAVVFSEALGELMLSAANG